MNLAFTICLATFGNGVRIGRRRVLRAFFVVARGTTALTAAAYLTATAATLTSGTTTSACASPCLVRPSPVKKNKTLRLFLS